jgi:hypothetical protein
MRVDFDDRTGVRLLREEKVVCHAEHRHTPCHNTSPVHMYKVRAHLARPEAEEDDESKVADRDDVIGNAPGTFESPRTPCQAAIVGFGDLCFVEDGEGRVGVVQVAAESSPEEEADCEEVGEVEAFENQGYRSVERSAVADVDECEECGEYCNDEDGDHWDCATLVDLSCVSCGYYTRKIISTYHTKSA